MYFSFDAGEESGKLLFKSRLFSRWPVANKRRRAHFSTSTSNSPKRVGAGYTTMTELAVIKIVDVCVS